MKRAIALGAVAALVVAGGILVSEMGAGAQLGPGDQITVCHATGSAQNPYVLQQVSATAGGPAGHGGHPDDIFAPYEFQQNQNAPVTQVPGQNTNLLPVLQNGCVVPSAGPTTTVPPTTTTVPPTTTTTGAGGAVAGGDGAEATTTTEPPEVAGEVVTAGDPEDPAPEPAPAADPVEAEPRFTG